MTPLDLSKLSPFDLAVLASLGIEGTGAATWAIAADLHCTDDCVVKSLRHIETAIACGLWEGTAAVGRPKKRTGEPRVCKVWGIYRDMYPAVRRWFDENPNAEEAAVAYGEPLL